MPPRLPVTGGSWRPVADSISSTVSSPSPFLPTLTVTSSAATSQPNASACPGSSRSFSATVPDAGRVQRRMMRQWLKENQPTYRDVLGRPDRPYTQYLSGDMSTPFPLNPHFKSLPVLSESARELIWEKIMVHGEPIKAVSAELGVDIRRIAAVVRLKEIEKEWISKKKPLARPYAKAFMSMLPQTRYDRENVVHEPFNEIAVHPYTLQQLFFPVSESREFNRTDAAKAFNRGLLSTDKRIPHPELVEMERQINVEGTEPYEAAKNFRDRVAESERLIADKAALEAREEARLTTRVTNSRGIEIRFKDYNVDEVGRNGKGLKGVGVRYGVASYDRKKGEVKIPTKVE